MSSKYIFKRMHSRWEEIQKMHEEIAYLKRYKEQNEIFEKGTSLATIINRLNNKPYEFYKKVYNELTPEERIFIIKHLENKCCENCINSACRIENYEKSGLDSNGNPEGSNCIGWNNDKYVGMAKVLRINDVNKLKFL